MNNSLDHFMTEIQCDEFDSNFEEELVYMERNEKTYVVVTDDGPCHKDVFLSWTTDMGGYYTTVDYIDEVNEYDFYDTVDQAIARAKDADSGTFGGWRAPMKVMEVLNFNEAYNDGEEPELVEVLTVELD